MAHKPDPEGAHWLLDKRINVGLLIGMVGQMMAFGWYAAKVDSRVEQAEIRITKAEARLSDYDRDSRETNSRLIRLEEKSASMLEILKDIQRAIAPPPLQRRTEHTAP